MQHLRSPDSHKKNPVVVLRSNDICFTGILRSLGVAGIKSIPVVFTWDGAGEWYSEQSKFFNEPVIIPNPYQFPREAVQAFAELGERLLAEWGEKLLVLPSSDVNLMFLVDNFDRFSKYFRYMGSMELDQSRKEIVSKDECFEILGRRNVCIPLTLRVRGGDDLENKLEKMIFPCVVKPSEKDYGQSFYRRNGGSKAREFKDKASCIEFIQQEFEFSDKLIVQEKVFFDSAYEEIPYYVYRDVSGHVRMAVGAIKEKIQPYPFGTATVLRLSHDQELMTIAKEVAGAINWRGFLMIEFIKDKKDGKWKVIELNPRPWLFIDFFRRAGFPFIQYWYEDVYGGICEKRDLVVPNYQTLADSPLHFNLTSIVCEHSKSHTVDMEWLKSFVSSYEGKRSFTYSDPSDVGPGEGELESITGRFPLEQGLLKEMIVAFTDL